MFAPMVGQRIYLKRVGNNARNRKPDDLIVEAEVSKVGRQYFYADIGYARNLKFSIDEWRHDSGNYSSEWSAYAVKRDIEDEREVSSLARALGDVFAVSRGARLGLDKLRRIAAIVDED